MLSTAINGSLSAYTSSKTYSPSFKYGAELVEKHIGSPVTSTLTTASRLTGVDSTVRWLYKRPNSGTQEGRLTRRRTTDDNDREDRDVEKGLHDGLPCLERRDSATPVPDILPSYDPGGRSPAYETHDSSTQPRQEPPPPRNHSLPTRVVMTTSGLRAACNEQSLKSLKYCLSWLRWTNDRVGSMTSSLKSTIEEHHASRQEPPTQPSADADGDTQMSSEPRDQSTIIQSMRSLRSGILDGITHVVGIVSTYAGGALPENARKLVRRQILSVPSRFYLLSPSEDGGSPPAQSTPTQSTQTQSPSSQSIQASSAPAPSTVTQRTSAEAERSSAENEIKGAERVVILATEALDMMTQISGIIAGTIHSAENWLDRFGRRQSGEGRNEEPQLAKKQPLDQGATPQIVLDEKEHLKLFEEKEEER